MIVLKSRTKILRDDLTSGNPVTQGQLTKVYNVLTNGRGKGSLAAKILLKYVSLLSLTLHCTQHTCCSRVSLCTAHNTHAALQLHSALHTTHMPLYSLTLHYTQHTCRSTVSLCTAHNTHAALQSHSALHTTHTPLYDLMPHHLIYITT